MHDRLGNSQTEYRKAHRNLDFQPRAKRRPDIRIWPFRVDENAIFHFRALHHFEVTWDGFLGGATGEASGVRGGLVVC